MSSQRTAAASPASSRGGRSRARSGAGVPKPRGHDDAEAETDAGPATRTSTHTGTHTDAAAPLLAATSALRTALEATPLPFELDGTADLRDARGAVLEQLDDYVLPRLANLRRPPLVVVGGPTGVGKSTLVNSLLGERVTRPGSLRPTTRSPVLVHHPAERSWFTGQHVLPALARTDDPADDSGTIQMVASSAVPRGIALMDAPDFDSVEDQNRTTAVRLLAAADVWMFVTSAARYSDQLPWHHLEHALERDLTVVVVMNRIPPEDLARVSADLRRRLDARGFPAERSFFVRNGPVDDDGALPPSYVSDLSGFLVSLAEQATSGTPLAQPTLNGAILRAAAVAERVAAAAGRQVAALAELATEVDVASAAALEEARCTLTDGSLVSGQLVSQWQDISGRQGTGTVAESFVAVRGRMVDGGADLGPLVRRLELALNVAVEGALVTTAEHGARRAEQMLRATTHGEALLSWSEEDLTRPGKAFRAQLPTAIGAWQGRVADIVRQELVSNDMAEGLDDAGIRGLAAAIGVHVLSTPGAHTPRSAAVDHEGLRGLLLRAAEDLDGTVEELLALERARYVPAPPWQLGPDAPTRLGEAAVALTEALSRYDDAGLVSA